MPRQPRQPRNIKDSKETEIKSKKIDRELLAHIRFTKKSITGKGYTYFKLPLNEVEKNLDFPLKKFALEKIAKKGHTRIAEFGCGTGIASRTLQEELGDKAEIYANSLVPDPEWKNNRNVNWVVARFEKFVEILKKRLKGKKLDLIFSHMGLAHTDSEHLISELMDLLEVGGKIIMDTNQNLHLGNLMMMNPKFEFDAKETKFGRVIIITKTF
ncbi:MAG: methyltransferase domain-containing protein [Candidatus Diapherotrites archaeon]|nr:methyltransferase domain-containing protein [Candidatus Diapherotrites archaeon]